MKTCIECGWPLPCDCVEGNQARFAEARLLEDPTGDFKTRVLEMSEQEQRDRIINQASTINSYQKCLDGLGIKTPGCIEGHRRPDDIRRTVETLLGSSNRVLSDSDNTP